VFALAPDGRSVAVTGNSRPPKVLDAATGAVTAELAALESGAAAIAYTPDGKSIVLAGLDGKVHVWEPAGSAPPRTITPTTAGIAHLRLSADGKTVALTGNQGGLRVLDLASGVERRAWPTPVGRATAARIALAPNGSVVAMARGGAAGVQLLDVATGADRVGGDGHDSLVTGLAFAAGGRTLVSAAADRVCV
jgi:WD40 repeat protein